MINPVPSSTVAPKPLPKGSAPFEITRTESIYVSLSVNEKEELSFSGVPYVRSVETDSLPDDTSDKVDKVVRKGLTNPTDSLADT